MSPYPVDEQLRCYHPAQVKEQHGKHGTLPRMPNVSRLARYTDLNRPENPEFHKRPLALPVITTP